MESSVARTCISNGKKNDFGQNPELRNLKILFFIFEFLVVAGIVMPQYFGVHLGYDITCSRLANILIIMYMLFNPKLVTHFCKTVLRCNVVFPIVIYLFVAGYTMVFRVDVNAFFLVFLEMLTLFMLIYGIRYVVGYKRAFRWIIFCAYFLSAYGLVEFACGQSLFLKFFKTMASAVVNTYRSGHYRIMGPCGHPLGYGLVLLLFIALASLDLERNEVYLFKRPILIVLLIMNVFLTGSRSTLGIAAFEVIVIICISNRNNIKKTLCILLGLVVALGIFLLLFHNTGIGRYILMQITSLIDQALGTEYSALFGADIATLNNSEGYRKFLVRIFTLDWLNPLVGRGVKRGFGAEFDGVYISSIDNYYVQQFVKYAYPGLISYSLFILVTGFSMIRGIIKYKSALCKLTLVATISYFVNLWWLDALQTLKYEYVVIAVFYAFMLLKQDEEKRERLL